MSLQSTPFAGTPVPSPSSPPVPLYNDSAQPLAASPGRDDLAVLRDQYLIHLRAYANRSPLTVTAYGADLRDFVQWCDELGIKKVSELERPHLHRYSAALPYTGKRGTGNLAPASVARKVHALGSFCNYLVGQGLLGANLAAGIPLPTREKTLPRHPEDDECRRLLGAATCPRDKAVTALMFMAGLRRAEVLAANSEDISRGCGQLLVHGKGRRERIVPICAPLVAIVEAHLEERGGLPGPLFTGRTGERMSVTCLTRMFSRLLREAGLQGLGLTPHQLRHAFATKLVREGADVATIAELMGHNNISTTSVYLHSNPATKRTAVDRLTWDESDVPDPAGGDEVPDLPVLEPAPLSIAELIRMPGFRL